jgi:hypothetical protein
MHDEDRAARWVKSCVFSAIALLLALAVPAHAQSPAGSNTWTFSTDTSNNLLIQDLESLATAQGVVGPPVCLRFYPLCPSASERRSADLRLARPRYTLRAGGKGGDWRVEPGQPTVRDTGTILPFQVGVQEQGMVQVVSSPGAWSVDLQRIPAAELRVGDGKRWNVFLALAGAPPASASETCWIEVGCAVPGS